MNDKEKERLEFLMRDAVRGFPAHCGMTAVSLEPGRFVTRIYLEERHLQQDGFVHAGVISTLADHTAGYASFSLTPSGRRILTVEYKINFLAPAFGEYIECRAGVLKPGRRILAAESEVFAVKNSTEILVAKALLTMAAVPAEELPNRS